MLALSTALALPGALFATSVASAAPDEETVAEPEKVDLEKLREARKKRGAAYSISPRVSRYLVAAAETAEEEDDAEAGLALLERLNLPRLNPHERAYVYRHRAYLSYSAESYDEAIENFRKMLGEEVMTLDVDNRVRFAIAQIYASLQRWPEALEALDDWLRYTEEPTALGYYLLGMSNFQIQKLDLAIAYTEKAIDLAEEPNESWLQLLAALYVQKEDYASATPVLEELVVRFPKKQYWDQLSLIYGARNDYPRSLAVQQVAYAQGLLTEDKDLRRLTRSYLYAELPYPAARVLEKGLEDGHIERDPAAYELLANSWIAAREYDRSLVPLATAAELSQDGKLLVRLGQVHLQREEWGKAAVRLQEALRKGGLEDQGAAQLLLGIAYYEDAQIGAARSAFGRAREHQDAKAEADRWLTHIDDELAKSTRETQG
jgi:uncharacterized protein HemY